MDQLITVVISTCSSHSLLLNYQRLNYFDHFLNSWLFYPFECFLRKYLDVTLRIRQPEDGIDMVFLTTITAEGRIYWGN